MAGFETGTGPDDVPVLRVSGDLDLAADSGRELRLAAVPAPVSRVLEPSGLRGLFTERPAS